MKRFCKASLVLAMFPVFLLWGLALACYECGECLRKAWRNEL